MKRRQIVCYPSMYVWYVFIKAELDVGETSRSENHVLERPGYPGPGKAMGPGCQLLVRPEVRTSCGETHLRVCVWA